MDKSIDSIYQEALDELGGVSDMEALEAFSVRYLGRKNAVSRPLRPK